MDAFQAELQETLRAAQMGNKKPGEEPFKVGVDPWANTPGDKKNPNEPSIFDHFTHE